MSFGAKGQNGLEPAICRTLWREQYLLRGVKPQTEFAGLFGASFFLPFGAKAYGVVFSVYTEWGKSLWELWRQVHFWDFCQNCSFQTVHAFPGLRQRVAQVFASDKTLRKLPSEDDHPCAVLSVLSYFAHGLFGFSRKGPGSFGLNLAPDAILCTSVHIAWF